MQQKIPHGVAGAMLRRGYDLSGICEVQDVTLEFVENGRKTMNGKNN